MARHHFESVEHALSGITLLIGFSTTLNRRASKILCLKKYYKKLWLYRFIKENGNIQIK